MVNLSDFGFDFLQPIDLPEEKNEEDDDLSDSQQNHDQVQKNHNLVTIPLENLEGIDLESEVMDDENPSSRTVQLNEKFNLSHVDKLSTAYRLPRRIKKVRKKDYLKYGYGVQRRRRKCNRKRKIGCLASYEEAKAFCREKGIDSLVQFKKYAVKVGLPQHIPVAIWVAYPEYDPDDFFEGRNTWYNDQMQAKYLSAEQAQKLVQAMGVTNLKDYLVFREQYNRGRDKNLLPRKPIVKYAGAFHSSYDFFGVTQVSEAAIKRGILISYNQAKEFVQSLGLKSEAEWRLYCKSKYFPLFLSRIPERKYIEFEGWKLFLGKNKDVASFLDMKQRTKVILGLFQSVLDRTSFVYQIFSGGVLAVQEFERTSTYKLVRIYEFNTSWKIKWMQLVDEHSEFHERNAFFTSNINSLLFEADAVLKQKGVK